MPKVDMNGTLIYDNQAYGPGKDIDVPQGLADHIAANAAPPIDNPPASLTEVADSSSVVTAVQQENVSLKQELDVLTQEKAAATNLAETLQTQMLALQTDNKAMGEQVTQLQQQLVQAQTQLAESQKAASASAQSAMDAAAGKAKGA